MPRTSSSGLRVSDSRRVFSRAVWTGLSILSVVLLSRRFSGMLSSSLSDLTTCSVATLAAFLSIASYLIFWSVDIPSRWTSPNILLGIVSLVPPFVIAIAINPAPGTVAASYLFSLFLFSATALLIFEGMQTKESLSRISPAYSEMPADYGNRESGTLMSDPEENEALIAAVSLPSEESNFAHWMQRSDIEGGAERIDGGLSSFFAAGRKQTIAHVAFIPPLAEQPRVECYLLDDVVVRLKVAAIYPYGMRIELRRGDTCLDNLTVRIGFSASTAALQCEAA